MLFSQCLRPSLHRFLRRLVCLVVKSFFCLFVLRCCRFWLGIFVPITIVSALRGLRRFTTGNAGEIAPQGSQIAIPQFRACYARFLPHKAKWPCALFCLASERRNSNGRHVRAYKPAVSSRAANGLSSYA